MIDKKACEWLIVNGDVTTRYRVYNELLCLENEADKLKNELLENEKVKYWLNALKPETPPQHWSMHHGSFDFNLENALLKSPNWACMRVLNKCGTRSVIIWIISKVTCRIKVRARPLS